jgi:hypothetical protein
MNALPGSLLSLALLTSIVVAQPATKMMIRPAPIPQRVAQAAIVIVGKVTSIEKKLIALPAFPGSEAKIDYLVAVVKIEEALKDAKDVTSVRVGLQQPPPAPGGRRGPMIRPGIRTPTLSQDQEVCLFLKPHHSGEFYILQAYFDLIDKQSENFEREIKLARKCAKLLSDPDQSLKSKDPKDRLLTAAMLISKYRMRPLHSEGEPKQESIDAAQSKQILHVLAESAWTTAEDPELGYLTPQNLFFQLGLTDKDGYRAPQDFQQIPNVAKAWLTKNADTYRIQRFVEQKNK